MKSISNSSYGGRASFLLVFLMVNWVFGNISFTHDIVDADGPKDPWIKIIADIDGDLNQDIIIGGHNGPLVWYAFPTLENLLIAKGGYHM